MNFETPITGKQSVEDLMREQGRDKFELALKDLLTEEEWSSVKQGGAVFNEGVKTEEAVHSDFVLANHLYTLTGNMIYGMGNLDALTEVEKDQVAETLAIKKTDLDSVDKKLLSKTVKDRFYSEIESELREQEFILNQTNADEQMRALREYEAMLLTKIAYKATTLDLDSFAKLIKEAVNFDKRLLAQRREKYNMPNKEDRIFEDVQYLVNTLKALQSQNP